MSVPLRPPLLRRWLTRLALGLCAVPRDASRIGLRRHRTRTALVHRDQSLTFASLEQRVGRLVAVLQARGLGRGALTFSCFDDGPEFLVARLAAFELGLCQASIAPWAQPSTLEGYLQLGAPKLLLLDGGLPEGLRQGLRALCACETLETGPEWEALLAACAPARSRQKVLPGDAAGIGFTSGTTGAPKVVTTPQAALIKSLTLTATNVRVSFGEQEVMLTGIPLSGAGSGVVLPVALTGATLVLPHSRAPGDLLELMRAHQVTRAFFTPSQLLDLLDDDRFSRDFLPSLRNVIYGTAPMPVPRLEEALVRLGPIFQQGYGLAEVLPPVSLLQMEQHLDARGQPAPREVLRSVGWVVPEVRVRIVDDALAEVSPGTLGEILIQSPTAFEGYWRPDGVDRSAFHQGFLRTGDLGTLRADGLLTVLDRRVDRLVLRQVSHSARLLEEAVYDEPAVKEACLVQRASEAPVVLFVSPRRARLLEPTALRRRLAQAGLEVAEVRVLPALPRSPLQKLLRRDVRQLLS